ncbi:expressed unknown protein [Seminavis robusta]|uniref:Uncharacterized protein n=1 Tax=Seminavis robusta TaxID=568900 RepID=A0A9N8H441_9STRA|nr:expressed unknown protein [Seminavis robusta]|eukprot:Sro52_g031240.1 n/a (602) ;mRNA; r:146630-148533
MSDNDASVLWWERVEKEVLALTTSSPSDDRDKKVLPAFMKVQDHQLDKETGTCIVPFQVEIKTAVVTITLDASWKAQPGDGEDTDSSCYPNIPPRITVTDGASCFPEGSTIQNGDLVTIDCVWAPSLQLTDAVLNIGLKIKESILQQEPFHPAPKESSQKEEKDSMMSSARAAIGRRLSGLVTSKNNNNNSNHNKNATINSSSSHHSRSSKKKASKKLSSSSHHTIKVEEVRIGAEINLLEPPWVESQGIYSCKAVRRPEFVEAAIQHAALESGEQVSSGGSGPASMFRSLTQSAKNVLQESFIMITDNHIVEMTSSKLNLSVGKVTFAIPIDLLAKLKFRRQESISLFFKTAPNDPLIYMCPDSADAVHQIQAVLKRHGVKGKHTNAAAHRAIGEALHLVQEIQTKELALRHDPTVERVNEIMDLYRQAAERFEAAGDVRHEEVVTHMRKFLALPVTVGILDGTYTKKTPDTRTSNKASLEGEVLEASSAQLNYASEEEEDDDGKDKNDDDGKNKHTKKKDDDKDFEANMESIMKEAKEDLAHFATDDDDDDEDNAVPLSSSAPRVSGAGDSDDIVDDAFADLDAMLSEADKELAELMGS